MADKPAEILLFDFLTDKINASAVDSVIYALELHDTIYQTIVKPRGIRISDVVGNFSPTATMVENEYDVFITLSCFVRVAGKNKQDRQPALTQVFEIQQAVFATLRSDPTLGTRVCDCLLQRGARGYDAYDGEPFAVAIVPIIINPSGARYNEQ